MSIELNPVSTTHTVTGAIVGVDVVRTNRLSIGGVVWQIVWPWVLTIPFAAVIVALIDGVITFFVK